MPSVSCLVLLYFVVSSLVPPFPLQEDSSYFLITFSPHLLFYFCFLCRPGGRFEARARRAGGSGGARGQAGPQGDLCAETAGQYRDLTVWNERRIP